MARSSGSSAQIETTTPDYTCILHPYVVTVFLFPARYTEGGVYHEALHLFTLQHVETGCVHSAPCCVHVCMQPIQTAGTYRKAFVQLSWNCIRDHHSLTHKLYLFSLGNLAGILLGKKSCQYSLPMTNASFKWQSVLETHIHCWDVRNLLTQPVMLRSSAVTSIHPLTGSVNIWVSVYRPNDQQRPPNHAWAHVQSVGQTHFNEN